MKPYVLIAEDESAVSELLFYNLKKKIMMSPSPVTVKRLCS